jgi:hypothetical protein
MSKKVTYPIMRDEKMPVKPAKYCIRCGELRKGYHKCHPERVKARQIETARRVILDGGTAAEKIFYKRWFAKNRHTKKAV